ncbi:MAG: hypothetical protein A3K60_01350 [Euryarchaeota archaeon RBG_19FT_COMBO_56_21]|nr:MAG: hypothetical protein A3K60_01350 [Euryarchaeota archaeon RBG_19FT_COMBO_56_21]
MGKLELPMPDMGKGLKAAAKDLETKIRAHVPVEFKKSVAVTAFKRGKATGLAIEYDDRAENHVYAAIEYPVGGGKGESVDPSR